MRSLVVLLFLFNFVNCFAGGWIQKADFGGTTIRDFSATTLNGCAHVASRTTTQRSSQITNANGEMVLSSAWSQLSAIQTNSWGDGPYLCSIFYEQKALRSVNLMIQ